MKEWVLQNTDVKEDEYDSFINEYIIKMVDSKPSETDEKYLLNSHPLNRVKKFTLKKPTKFRCKVYNIKKNGKYYIYKDIKFRILAEIVSKKFSKELYNKKRIGTCFMKSIEICMNDKNSKIITAMCVSPCLIPIYKFVHTFVVKVGQDGKEYVLDATLNIILEKDFYLKLYNAKIISEIYHKEFMEFMNCIKDNEELKETLTLAEYLCFPTEITKSVKKYIKTR